MDLVNNVGNFFSGAGGGGGGGDAIERTPEAKELLERLKAQAERGVLFGHQDTTAYGVGWTDDSERSDVKDVCGEWPAVYGWDLGNIAKGGDDSGTNIDGVSFGEIRDEIKKGHARGGLNTISFHQNNPITGDSAFDNTEAVSKILPPEDSNTQKFFEVISKLSKFLLSLKDDNGTLIPVVLRLYHEHNQEWSWWGSKVASPDQYQELYRMVVRKLREDGATHVLFCYSPQDVKDRDEYMIGYPGDEFVDVFGLDFYMVCDKEQMELLSDALKMIVGIAEEKDKVAALTETGIQNVPIKDWWSDYLLPVLRRDKVSRIAWVLLWRNQGEDHFFVPYEGHKSDEDFKTFQQAEQIQFDKLP